MSSAPSNFDADATDLFRLHVERMETRDLANYRRVFEQSPPELVIIDAELAKRKPGFSLPLVRHLDRAADAGDRDAAELLAGPNAGNDVGARDGCSTWDDPAQMPAAGSYPGGKGMAGTYHKIIRLMPPHEVYVEPFLGHSAIMRHKKPAGNSFGVDIDRNVIRWWYGKLRETPIGNLQLIEGDGVKKLRDMWLDDRTLVYCDPPYLRAVCTSRSRYRHSFDTPAEHKRLLDQLLKIAEAGCRVMVSGYYSTLYAATLRGWHMESFVQQTRGGRDRQECLWCSFVPPAASGEQLHDARYAGKDYRQRFTLKRKINRWKGKWDKLEPFERQAIAEALGLTSADNARSSVARSMSRTKEEH